MHIREQIKNLLSERQISVRALSQKSAVRRQSIMHFLKGGGIHIDNLQKIMEAIGCEMVITPRNKQTSQDAPRFKQRLKFNAAELAKFCKKNSIARLKVFGSVLREDFSNESDIDVVIELKKPVSFFELAAIEEKLQKIFRTKHKLDVVTPGSLSPLIADEIKNASEVVYEKAA